MDYLAREGSNFDQDDPNKYLVTDAGIACTGNYKFRFKPPNRGITIGTEGNDYVGLACDTNKSYFEVRAGTKCKFLDGPCQMDLLPTWSDPVDSVVYNDAASTEEKQVWIRGRGQYDSSLKYATLDKASVVYCKHGGVLRAYASGQGSSTIEHELVEIDEVVHVIITWRNNDIYPSSLVHAGDSVDPQSDINTWLPQFIENTLGSDAKYVYNNNKYNYKPDLHSNIVSNYGADSDPKKEYANIFLPFVFKENAYRNLSTKREVNRIYPDGKSGENPKVNLQSVTGSYNNYAIEQLYKLKMVVQTKNSAYISKQSAYNRAKDAAQTNPSSQDLAQTEREAKSAFNTAKTSLNTALKAYYKKMYEMQEYYNSGQKDTDAKITQYREQCEKALKLLYMLYFAREAKAKYNEHLRNDGYQTNSLHGSVKTKCPLPSLYRQNGTYGMWGQFYEMSNGFHRGIDVNVEKGHSIYTILSGYLVHRGSYWVNIYNPSLDITVTYMHHDESNAMLEKRPPVEPFSVLRGLPFVSQWLEIGNESNNPGTFDNHTHFEVNNGVYAPNYTPFLLLEMFSDGERILVGTDLNIPEHLSGYAILKELKIPFSSGVYSNLEAIGSDKTSRSWVLTCKDGALYNGANLFQYEIPIDAGRNVYRPWAGGATISLTNVEEGKNFSNNPYDAIATAWDSL